MAQATPEAPAAPSIRDSRLDPRGLLKLILFVFVGALLIPVFLQYKHSREEAAKKDASQIVAVSAPRLPCPDAWTRQAQGIGDHRKEDVDHFDVEPTTPGCFSELIYEPSDWSRWEKMVISGKQDGSNCTIWFWLFGSDPVGPYSQNNLPEFPATVPRPWRVSTDCTIRYFQTATF